MGDNTTTKIITARDPNDAEQSLKKVCLEQLSQDRHMLLVRWPFIGSVLMRMELIPVRDDRLDTACTDGDNIFVDVNFYAKLSKDERLFVLAHEVWHSVLLHFARRQKRDAERFNIAADLEIHFTLKDDHMKEPFVLPHDPKWQGLSAEEIYEKLPAFCEKHKNSSANGNGSKTDSSPGATSKKGDASSPFGDTQSSFDKHIYQGDKEPSDQDKSDASSDQAVDFVIDKDYNPAVNENTVERSRSRTVAAAQQVERSQGKLPAHLQSLLEKLLAPSLPWQELLKQFVTSCYGGKRRWLPPARRHVWQDLYLPSMRDESLKAVVALDTSGSTARDLPAFFGELVSLMKSFGKFELDVIQCDAVIQKVEHFSDARIPPADMKWEVRGHGGTDFRPVFDYIAKNMKEQPDLLLFFTDGYGPAPTKRPAYPVMWILTHGGQIPAKWGRVVQFRN